MINIPSPNTTYYMISNLDAGATYSIGIIAYADLPTEITDPVLVTLNGKNTRTHTHTHKLIWCTIGPKSFIFGTAQFSLWARWHS